MVDDDIDLHLLGVTVLVHSGYQVDTAGWEALHAHTNDLLITDNDAAKLAKPAAGSWFAAMMIPLRSPVFS